MSIAARLRRLFVYAPPDPIGFWSGRAKDEGWLSVMWRNPAYNDLAHADQWRAIEHALPANRTAILDLGCGTGRLTGRLAGLFGEYVGVDLDTMVDEAARRNPDVPATYVASSVQDFEFPLDQFDLVLSMACLASACRAEEMANVARRMVDSTKSGGRIVMIEPFHRLPALVRTCRASSSEIIAHFEHAGAKLERWSGMHCVPVRLAFAREAFAQSAGLTRAAYRLGELLSKLAPRLLGDYKVLVFRGRTFYIDGQDGQDCRESE